MKMHIGVAVSVMVAALVLSPVAVSVAPQPVAAQDQSQDQQNGGGMAEFQAHSVHGDITAISGNTITIKTDNGEVYTIATGPNTRFRKQRDQIKITDLHVGDTVAAMGDKDPKAKTVGAMFVVFVDKQQEQKMRADFGKTWTAGVVQSIDGTNIVIKRPDNISQTVSVDENTSFRRHREDITLPDIKVGDNLSARGALQNGSFLATEVNIGGRGSFNGGGANGWSGRRNGSTPNPGTTQPDPQSNN